MGTFYTYLGAFWPHWWPLVTAGGLFGVDSLIRGRWEWAERQLDRIPAPKRRQIEYVTLLVAVFVSGFLAWQDEHTARLADAHRATSPAEWESLPREIKSRLSVELRPIPPKPITIACETLNCKNLADDFAEAFRGAGWNPKVIHGGGLDVMGVTGISVAPDSKVTHSIEVAIETATALHVEIAQIKESQYGNNPILLVVGIKPF